MLIQSVYVTVPPLGIAVVLAEVLPHGDLCLLGVEVLRGTAVMHDPHRRIVLYPVSVLLILEAHPLEVRCLCELFHHRCSFLYTVGNKLIDFFWLMSLIIFFFFLFFF